MSSTPPTLDMASILTDRANRVVVCCGAGGVGKTTTAAAMALRAAEYGRTVVVLTIDPARRLAQALGIKDLGEETKLAASVLVMAIIGGAFTPLMMGIISDKTKNMQIAYIMPMICFLFILYFGVKGYKNKQPQSAIA